MSHDECRCYENPDAWREAARPRFEVRVLGVWTVVESMTGTREQLRSQMRWYARPFLTLHKRVPDRSEQ